MFGFGQIGGGELLAILVLALLLFGPRKIPEIGRTVGKALAQFRRASHEFRSGLEREVEVERLKEAGEAVRSLKDEVRSVPRDLAGASLDASASKPSDGRGTTPAEPGGGSADPGVPSAGSGAASGGAPAGDRSGETDANEPGSDDAQRESVHGQDEARDRPRR